MIIFCKHMHKILPITFRLCILLVCVSSPALSQQGTRFSAASQDSTHSAVDSLSAQPKDPWFGLDKMHHLSVSAFLVGAQMYIYRQHTSMNDSQALQVAMTTTAILGLGKELYDVVSGKGTGSVKDMLANLAGMMLAASVFIIP